jgi:hypothetical protein
MAGKLVDRLDILVSVRRFRSMGARDSRTYCSNAYVRMKGFVHQSTSILNRRLLDDVRREFM